MSAPLLTQTEQPQDIPEIEPLLGRWVQGALLGIVLGLATVFGIAIYLNPYDDNGAPLDHGTHQKLGLPPCTFYFMTGYPCPSCGMTTSFSLLMHGDPVNSARANFMGTALALFCLAFIPWALVTAWRRKPVFITSMERSFMVVVMGFMVLTLLRWGVVLGIMWWQRNHGA